MQTGGFGKKHTTTIAPFLKGLDKSIVPDNVFKRMDNLSFSVVAHNINDEFLGFVDLGTNVVFELKEPAEMTPAGIDDFANVVLKKFSQKLRKLLGDSDG